MNSLMILAMLCGAIQFSDEEDVADRVLNAVEQRGYRRIGVLPRFIVREGNKEVLGGSIGPQADYLAEALEDTLLQRAGFREIRLGLVDGARMQAAFKDLTIDDLGDAEALRKVSQRVGGLDALVVARVLDRREERGSGSNPHLAIRARVIDLKDGTVATSGNEQASISLSDAAYMGESWELRRWQNGRLVNVGIGKSEFGSDSPNAAFGTGWLYETLHYPAIKRNQPHPQLNPSCPFKIDVRVGDEVRPLTRVGDQLYVALDPGESYRLRVTNNANQAVYMSLFVDGINVLGKKREHPSNSKFWFLKPRGAYRFDGWATKAGNDGKYHFEEFVITAADDTVAAGEGFSDRLGMITAVFYTAGMKGVPKAPMVLAAAMPGSFGTGAGQGSDEFLEERKVSKPGPILAAMTIHYTTSSRLQQLR